MPFKTRADKIQADTRKQMINDTRVTPITEGEEIFQPPNYIVADLRKSIILSVLAIIFLLVLYYW